MFLIRLTLASFQILNHQFYRAGVGTPLVLCLLGSTGKPHASFAPHLRSSLSRLNKIQMESKASQLTLSCSYSSHSATIPLEFWPFSSETRHNSLGDGAVQRRCAPSPGWCCLDRHRRLRRLEPGWLPGPAPAYLGLQFLRFAGPPRGARVRRRTAGSGAHPRRGRDLRGGPLHCNRPPANLASIG